MPKKLSVEEAATAAAEVREIGLAVNRLRLNEFDSLTQAALFCAAATADANGHPETLIGVAAAAAVPISTASRVVYELEQRGLLAYGAFPGDRRKKLIRANLGALK